MWEWVAKLGYAYRVRTGSDERMVTIEPHHVKVGFSHEDVSIPKLMHSTVYHLHSQSWLQTSTVGRKVMHRIHFCGNVILAGTTGPVFIHQMHSVLGTGVFNADGQYVRHHSTALCLNDISRTGDMWK